MKNIAINVKQQKETQDSFIGIKFENAQDAVRLIQKLANATRILRKGEVPAVTISFQGEILSDPIHDDDES